MTTNHLRLLVVQSSEQQQHILNADQTLCDLQHNYAVINEVQSQTFRETTIFVSVTIH